MYNEAYYLKCYYEAMKNKTEEQEQDLKALQRIVQEYEYTSYTYRRTVVKPFVEQFADLVETVKKEFQAKSEIIKQLKKLVEDLKNKKDKGLRYHEALYLLNTLDEDNPFKISKTTFNKIENLVRG